MGGLLSTGPTPSSSRVNQGRYGGLNPKFILYGSKNLLGLILSSSPYPRYCTRGSFWKLVCVVQEIVFGIINLIV